MLNGTGIETPKQSDLFASHVIKLYTNVIGDWSYIIIASATFSIMFGTCIAVFDGYARSLKKTIQLIMKKNDVSEKKELKLYRTNLVVVMTGALLLIWKFEDSGDFGILVNIATIISFMIAPVVAIFNFTLVKEKYIGKESTPPIWLKILSYLGIIFLIGFSIFYITQLI